MSCGTENSYRAGGSDGGDSNLGDGDEDGGSVDLVYTLFTYACVGKFYSDCGNKYDSEKCDDSAEDLQ